MPVTARLIGVIEAEQTQDGKTFRNDRMLAVAQESRQYEGVRDLSDLPRTLVAEIEQFFVNYNLMRGRVFKPLRRLGAKNAMAILKTGIDQAKRKTKRQSSPCATECVVAPQGPAARTFSYAQARAALSRTRTRWNVIAH